MTSKRFDNIDWTSTIFLSATPIVTVILMVVFFMTETFNLWLIPVFLFFYFAMGMSITGGYHRLIAHKSYDANSLVKFFYLFFGAGAFQNSARVWAIDHRFHHRYVDQERDPYSIKKGFWYAHFVWMCQKDNLVQRLTPQARSYSRDLDKDALIVWQDKYYIPIAVVSCFIVPALAGWLIADSWFGGLVFGGFLRMVLVHHFTFFINSLCHFWGRQPYTDENSARDNVIAALVTYGEGYHNFHHIFAVDYRNGIRWYHFDPTKWFIQFLALIRMVRNLKVTPEYEIFKAKMQMAEKNMRHKKETQLVQVEKFLETFKHKAEEAHQRWEQLKGEYETLKFNLQTNKDEKLKQMRRDIQQAKADFRMACEMWSMCLKAAY